MVMKLYTIYDKVANEGSPVFEAKNDGMAQRQMALFLQKFPRYGNEFKLICVGTIDHEKNKVKPWTYDVQSLENIEPDEEGIET